MYKRYVIPCRFVTVMLLLLVIASCSSSKKAAKDGADNVMLDPIEVTATRNTPYRAAVTKDFDLVHTKLEVSFNYQKQHLNGKATITLKPHFYPQNKLVLDAKQFDVQEVSIVKGDTRAPLTFTYDSQQISIDLDKTYVRDEKFDVCVFYTAKPNERKTGGSSAISSDKGLYFINPLGEDTGKPVQIWTQGETESNSCWFPTIDKPNQKTTQEIYITHHKKYVSLSNGILVSTKASDDSTVTDCWRMGLPHAPYLFMMAIGDFAVVNDRWRDVPVSYYVERAYEPYARQIFGNTPEMMEFFSQKLGFDYPWSKYAQVVVRDYVSGAMENTSATLHGEFIQRNSRELLDENYEDVISHELFHQWFGDLVTVESWSNTPLNESFATYGEYLWNEYKYGRDLADYHQLENYYKYMDESKTKNVDLIRFYYGDREDMFDRHSYEKGGMLLHYLRNIVGDDAFFKSLELYLKTNQFKAVEIHQLRLAFEEVTGRDLNWFFNQWFLNSGHPLLDIKYSYTPDSVFVAIEQKHNTDKSLLYTLPMAIDVYYSKNVKRYQVELNKKNHMFGFKAEGTPDLIDADADRVVLCERTEDKTTANYIFQYNNVRSFLPRYEAIDALGEQQKNGAAEVTATLATALRDSFYAIRELAIDKIDIARSGNEQYADSIVLLARNDKYSDVREAAIEKLGKANDLSKYEALFEAAVGDSSYSVSAAALKALLDANATKAMALAKTFENESNHHMIAAVAEVYSKEGDAGYQSYFSKKLNSAQGIGKYYMFYYYANFLTRMDKATVLTGVKDIEEAAKAVTDSHFLLGASKGALKRISKSFEDKKKRAKADQSKEDGKTAQIELEEKVNEYDAIISEINDALQRVNAAKH